MNNSVLAEIEIVDAAGQTIGYDSKNESVVLMRTASVDDADATMSWARKMVETCSSNEGTWVYTSHGEPVTGSVAWTSQINAGGDVQYEAWGQHGDLLVWVVNSNAADSVEVGETTLKHVLNHIDDLASSEG